MYALLMLAIPIVGMIFTSSMEQALSLAQNREWTRAAEALDQAYSDDPALFRANNLHYLRGRMAEAQTDWPRAVDEFSQIGGTNPLRPLAAWHGALSAIRFGAFDRAALLIDELPADFPPEMRIQLAAGVPPPLALRIYTGMKTRRARLERAALLADTAALWTLVRETNADDVALQSAELLTATAAASREWLDLADTFITHRHFDEATFFYRRLLSDPTHTARAQYQLARIQFLQQNYGAAVEGFRAVAVGFPGTDWEKDASNQVANAYWRNRQYPEAERAYTDYIARFSGKGIAEGAVRDLADVYRSLGENAKAIALIDRTLARRPTAATRQVLLFTKGKILYGEKRYAAALEIFRQLGKSRIQAVAGGTTLEEVRYFEALCLANTGKTAAANTLWKKLAASPRTYYGQRSAAKLRSMTPTPPSPSLCASKPDPALGAAIDRLAARRRPPRTEAIPFGPSADIVTELVFLQLWDEASLWSERARRPEPALAADLNYASGRYHRAIAQAGRLPGSDPRTATIAYPAGFHETICAAAGTYGVDPLWLHAIIWQESKYNPNAQSAASARGLMQFIPDTAAAIATKAGVSDLKLDHLYDPQTNIRLGAYYWAALLSEFKYPELALAAYNGGPDNVRRWKDKLREAGADTELFVSEIGFVETKRYVQAVFGARAAYERLN